MEPAVLSIATSADVMAALLRRHRQRKNWHAPKYAIFPELRTGIGFARESQRYVDLWVLNTWSSERAVDAYEIKVSRSDFLHEVSRPEKRAMALRYSNRYWFAAPRGLIAVEELPDEAGLLEVLPSGVARVAKQAPRRECEPSWELLSVVARRVHQIQEAAS